MDARLSYRQAATRGARPLQLVILLYQQGIDDLRRALLTRRIKPFLLRRAIELAASPAELAAVSAGLTPMIIALHDGRAAAEQVAAVRSVVLDALTRRLVELAVRDAGNAQEPLVVRSAAVRAVARTLPASEAVAVLRPVLATADVPLQRRAAEALATVGPEGCAALQAHTGKLSAEAQKPFAQALGRCPTP